LGLFNVCYSSAMTIGAPIGGLVLSRFGAPTLWFGTFAVALSAVAVYVAIHRSISLRLEAASDVASRPNVQQEFMEPDGGIVASGAQ
ncbi:MAG: hypothetical protein ACR2NZ_04980, partial [Rubripirellula sp.]